MRSRKLLLHKREINKLIGYVQQSLPNSSKSIFKKRVSKNRVAVARGKKQYDKRRDIARRDAERAMARAFGKAKEHTSINKYYNYILCMFLVIR